ncbi:MAG: universal stress protein [Candidatus Aminicenantes bacterium]|nr:universal stress protein [Candidatus Aminicenantes bacterium]
MLPFKKIIWPTDFSEPSYEALKAAGELAEKFSSVLYAVHVLPILPVIAGPTGPSGFNVSLYQEEMEKSAKKSMEEALETKVPKQIKTVSVIKQGDAAREITETADKEDADLIVISTHGETGWKHFVFGSVAEKVVRLSSIPVLTIHAPK